jgi:hypothetical protein
MSHSYLVFPNELVYESLPSRFPIGALLLFQNDDLCWPKAELIKLQKKHPKNKEIMKILNRLAIRKSPKLESGYKFYEYRTTIQSAKRNMEYRLKLVRSDFIKEIFNFTLKRLIDDLNKFNPEMELFVDFGEFHHFGVRDIEFYIELPMDFESKISDKSPQPFIELYNFIGPDFLKLTGDLEKDKENAIPWIEQINSICKRKNKKYVQSGDTNPLIEAMIGYVGVWDYVLKSQVLDYFDNR